MITFFTIPKPFEGRSAVTQTNAIRSWLKAVPGSEVILCGSDKGVTEAASAHGARHAVGIQTNEFGTPLVSDAFDRARAVARHQLLMYINADIILIPGFVSFLDLLTFKHFLVVGRRWDIDQDRLLCFDEDRWYDTILSEVRRNGRLHGYSGIDYMLFGRDLPLVLPPFAVGRQGWDNWVLWKVKRDMVPLVDATEAITAVHQNHGYGHSPYGQKERVGGPETVRNCRLAGGFKRMMTIREADFLLTRGGLRRPPLFRRLSGLLACSDLGLSLLSCKRAIQSR